MIKTLVIGLILAAGSATMASAVDVFVRIGPPRSIVELRSISPGRGYVWQPGYQNWNGNSHNWAPGRWEQSPPGHGRWQQHRWVKRRGGWVLVEGHWR